MSQNLNIWDELGIDEAECSRKRASGRRVVNAIRSLVYVRGLEFECSRVLPYLMYASEAMIWK